MLKRSFIALIGFLAFGLQVHAQKQISSDRPSEMLWMRSDATVSGQVDEGDSLDLLKSYEAYRQSGHSLKLVQKIKSPTASHFHYQHFTHGMKVHNSTLVIHISDRGVLTQNNLKRVSAVPFHPLTENRTWLIDQNGQYHLGIVREGGTHDHPTEYVEWEGHRHHETNRKLYFNGPDSLVKAKVFMVNPINTAGAKYGGNYIDNKDSTNASLDSQLREVEMRVLYRNDTFFIGDDRFHFRNVIDPPTPPVFSTSDTFFFDRSDIEFEDVNAFYHLSNYANYLISKGFKTLLYDTLVVDATAGQADASAFDPAAKTLEFGLGGVDDAEDGEVVIHEMVHSLSTKASPLTVSGNDRRSMEEGNCDYLASSYSIAYSDHDSWKVFSWDGHNEFWDGFVNNSKKSYKFDRTGFRDHDREIWSSALMCIHDKLGRNATDSLVLEQLFYQAKNTTMPQMAKVLLLIDTLQNGGVNNWAIKSCFHEHDILEPGSIKEQEVYEGIRVLNTLSFAQGNGPLLISTSENSKMEISIFDMSGKLVHRETVSQQTTQISPEILASGSYVLRIVQNNNVLTQKLLKY